MTDDILFGLSFVFLTLFFIGPLIVSGLIGLYIIFLRTGLTESEKKRWRKISTLSYFSSFLFFSIWIYLMLKSVPMTLFIFFTGIIATLYAYRNDLKLEKMMVKSYEEKDKQ